MLLIFKKSYVSKCNILIVNIEIFLKQCAVDIKLILYEFTLYFKAAA